MEGSAGSRRAAQAKEHPHFCYATGPTAAPASLV